MEYLDGCRAVIWSAASGCFDLVGRCCRVTLVAEPISTSTLQIVLVKRESSDSQKNNEENNITKMTIY